MFVTTFLPVSGIRRRTVSLDCFDAVKWRQFVHPDFVAQNISEVIFEVFGIERFS